jgi:hypothetical protein
MQIQLQVGTATVNGWENRHQRHAAIRQVIRQAIGFRGHHIYLRA